MTLPLSVLMVVVVVVVWQECAEGQAQDHTRAPSALHCCKQVTVEHLDQEDSLHWPAGSLNYPQQCWHAVCGGLQKVLEEGKVVALHGRN